MGFGRIARQLGKVGMLIESVGYVVAVGVALAETVRRRKSEQRDDRASESDDGLPGGEQYQRADGDRLQH